MSACGDGVCVCVCDVCICVCVREGESERANARAHTRARERNLSCADVGMRREALRLERVALTLAQLLTQPRGA